MTSKRHWNEVYASRDATDVSWYQPNLNTSLRFIDERRLPPNAHVVDIGGGASTLVDDLLARGFEHLTVIDLSQVALDRSRERLGEVAQTVQWLEGDATEAVLTPNSVDFWHDRAVFHFLTEKTQREAYVDNLRVALKPGGYALIATFDVDGPEKCSGLPVVRYSAESLSDELGDGFRLIDQQSEEHETPQERVQRFRYALFQRRS